MRQHRHVGRRAPALVVVTVALLVGLTLSQLVGRAGASEAAAWRRFLAAEQAFAAGELAQYQTLAAGLVDYPLYPYLRADELAAGLGEREPAPVLAFLTAHAGSAPAERLRRLWLQRLAREQRWPEYVAAYVDNGSLTRECQYRRALLATGNATAAFANFAEHYLTGASLPDACDPLIAAWAATGGLGADLVWSRIELALARNNTGVAAFQRRYLPADQRPWLDLTLALHRTPTQLLERIPGPAEVPDPARREAIIAHGLERLARRAPAQAITVRERLAASGDLSPALAERADLAIGVALAATDAPAALAWLDRLPARTDNTPAQRERLLAARQLQAWPALAAWAALLPENARDEGEWDWWRGRALLETALASGREPGRATAGPNVDMGADLGADRGADPGADARAGAAKRQRIAAAHAFADAARHRTLWGFLAADLLGRPPAMNHRPTPVDQARLDAMLGSGIETRITELRRLGREVDVRREWRALTDGRPTADLVTAGALAARLGLVNDAILTHARADFWDDLEIRFPLAHRPLVHAAAAEQGLPQDWIYAVIRQESAFATDIASHAGAIGLMQLMPATAAEVAARRGEPPPNTGTLIDPASNIALGADYLAQMRRRFAEHPLPATAAYNAGPGAVGRWVLDPTPGDLWMVQIPYRETRDYVRRVLTYRVFYRERLGLPPLRLNALVRQVGGRE